MAAIPREANAASILDGLSLKRFPSRKEARAMTETWRRHDNHVRPHQSLNDLTPAQFETRYDSAD